MIRFLLPEISFAGRLSRAAFWREIVLSIMWTPIVIATTSFLLREAAVVTDGIAGTGLSAGSLVGIAIFGLGVRNVVATLGAIKRRMQDRGYGASEVLKTVWPVLAMVLLAPFTLFNPLLGVFYAILLIVQIVVIFRTAGDLLLGPSHDAADQQTTSDPWRQFAETLAPEKGGSGQNPLDDARKHLALLAAGIVKGIQNIEMTEPGRAPWAERVLKDVQALGDKVSRNKFVGEAMQRLERLPQVPERVHDVDVRPDAMIVNDRNRRNVPRRQRTKTIYRSPPSRPVHVVHRLPRHGRSSWFDGLIAGPWG